MASYEANKTETATWGKQSQDARSRLRQAASRQPWAGLKTAQVLEGIMEETIKRPYEEALIEPYRRGHKSLIEP